MPATNSISVILSMTQIPKIFIDLGAYNGDTIAIALEKIPNIFATYGFEPLTTPFNQMKDRFFSERVFIEKAVADTVEGDARIYIGKKYGDIGSSTCPDNPNCDQNHYEIVRKIDFSKWFNDNIILKYKRSHVILKLNIEGGEYKILPKLIDDGYTAYIREIYCDWHWQLIGLSEENHHNLVGRLRSCGFSLCGDKPDEFYNSMHSTPTKTFFKKQFLFYKRSTKLLLKRIRQRLNLT
jgi:FkbM family methyltransferase